MRNIKYTHSTEEGCNAAAAISAVDPLIPKGDMGGLGKVSKPLLQGALLSPREPVATPIPSPPASSFIRTCISREDHAHWAKPPHTTDYQT